MFNALPLQSIENAHFVYFYLSFCLLKEKNIRTKHNGNLCMHAAYKCFSSHFCLWSQRVNQLIKRNNIRIKVITTSALSFNGSIQNVNMFSSFIFISILFFPPFRHRFVSGGTERKHENCVFVSLTFAIGVTITSHSQLNGSFSFNSFDWIMRNYGFL